MIDQKEVGKAFGMPVKEYEGRKGFLYKGIQNPKKEIMFCRVVLVESHFSISIQFENGNTIKIHPQYLAQMQAKNFGK